MVDKCFLRRENQDSEPQLSFNDNFEMNSQVLAFKEKIKEVIFQIAVILVITAVLFVAVEGIARLVFGPPKLPEAAVVGGPVVLQGEAAVNSEAYREFPWAREFVEIAQRNPGPSLQYEPFSLWKTLPHESKFKNVGVDGYRVTVNVEKESCDSNIDIYVFGGSAMVGVGIVRDIDLITSQLSISLSKYYENICIKVYNYASGGFNQGNEFVLLMRLLSAGKRPDLVIFYDGVNDVYHQVYFGKPHMAFDMFNWLTEIWSGAETLPGFFRRFGRKIADNLTIVSLFVPRSDYQWMRAADEDTLRQRARDVTEFMVGNMQVVRTLGREFGFELLFVLQPNLFTKKHLSDEEIYLLNANVNMESLPLVDQAYLLTYDAIRTRFEKDRPCGCFVDLSDAMGETERSIYVDLVHVSPAGNELVARKLATIIQERNLLNIGQ